jgi:hypothetical protein
MGELVGGQSDGVCLRSKREQHLAAETVQARPVTGNRKFLKETPEDVVGLGLPLAVRISGYEQSYAHSIERSISELFVVSGLK